AMVDEFLATQNLKLRSEPLSLPAVLDIAPPGELPVQAQAPLLASLRPRGPTDRSRRPRLRKRVFNPITKRPSLDIVSCGRRISGKRRCVTAAEIALEIVPLRCGVRLSPESECRSSTTGNGDSGCSGFTYIEKQL